MKNLLQRKVESSSIKEPKNKGETYLRVGDKVFHKKYQSWGGGIVTETWSSDLPGGFCFVRIQFQDGKKRVFDNSLRSACCCYYTGIILLNRIEL